MNKEEIENKLKMLKEDRENFGLTSNEEVVFMKLKKELKELENETN